METGEWGFDTSKNGEQIYPSHNQENCVIPCMKTRIIFLMALLVVGLTSCGVLGNCDSSYPGVCIPPPPPDLNCDDIEFRNFEVRGSDPHGFDGDNDGIGCE